jgi:hypothetical protein
MSDTVRVDLHSHTYFSRDCLTPFDQVVAAAGRAGLSVLAVTDHDAIEGALRLRDLAAFAVIVGEEVKTAEGEIIGLFIERFVPPGMSPEETLAAIHEQGGLAYVPHPFDRVRRSSLTRVALERVSDQLDVVEVFNARCIKADFNQSAAQFAAGRGLPAGAGSDAHTPGEYGRAYLEMPAFGDASSFMNAVSSARVVGRASPSYVHAFSTYAKLRRRLRRWLSKYPRRGATIV